MTEKKKGYLYKGLYVVGGLLLGFAGWFYASFLYLPAGTVAMGVKVGSVSVGDMPLTKAVSKLEPGLEKLEERPLILKAGDKNYTIVPQNKGIKIDRSVLKSKLLSIGRKGSLWQRMIIRFQGHKKAITLSPPIKTDKRKLSSFLKSVNAQVYKEPKEPKVALSKSGKFKITPEELGYNVNYQVAEKKLSRLVLNKNSRFGNIPIVKVYPKITEHEIEAQGIQEQIAKFTTYFDINNENRVHNIKTAAQALNNVLIKPGQTFSFNETVGPRSTEKNYKEAKVIINNEFVIGAGGGVCQVSSTLFNAALLADLKIVERLNHSRPVAYVGSGRDATVVFDAVDLKFKNTRSTPVLITAEVHQNGLTIRLWGQKDGNREIQLVTKEESRESQDITQKLDPELPMGETQVDEGSPGLKVSLWRQFWEGNKLVHEEEIGTSIYRRIDTVIKVGVGTGDSTIKGMAEGSFLPSEHF